MKRRLFWKLCTTITVGTIVLFWIIHHLILQTEQHMSFIDQHYQQQLIDYASHAEKLYLQGEEEKLADWINTIQQREDTWVALIRSKLTPLAGSEMDNYFIDNFALGRDISWKIHLYFAQNPIMDITFSDGHTHFLIRLPQRMRPGGYWTYTSLLLQIALPMLLLAILSMVIYRHVMSPLRQLEKATKQFSDGNYQVRVRDDLGKRNDEIASLASTFDSMAERIGTQIQTQRHLTSDLSHELRTPLTRVELALSIAEQSNPNDESLQRIRHECLQMRELVEDALTLAWLENERPALRNETLDLTDLIDSIVENARFEFPRHLISVQTPETACLQQSSDRALGHAIENILRNALSYTPAEGEVNLTLKQHTDHYDLQIDDQGPGVPEDQLQNIFKPFFRLNSVESGKHKGFGVGLALARRQVESTGGKLWAQLHEKGGLRMIIHLPIPV
ncbi:sensor histidine kinase [Methylophaga nitratireducenticrescens]|uniref:histidine kinase n=1 Tax=Methylophaga nitratireducenticrescens TaxID=754476 RepID=I1XII4_METNJ|nr:sensor histidine kinase [Methylophaga nitratireducenticrescens]AFI84203.1 two-component sensor histidine kinase [Methylophaga nitratireducenticrescens]AUZ84284.1 two-component sensor histidine kinase [Methylophaga nitratireducenticrescens]